MATPAAITARRPSGISSQDDRIQKETDVIRPGLGRLAVIRNVCTPAERNSFTPTFVQKK